MTISSPPAPEQTWTALRRSVLCVRARNGFGTAWVAAANGILVTNHHVVGYDVDVSVRTDDASQVPARVVWVDSRLDIAILLALEPIDAPALRLADSRQLAVGTPVVAIGHPLGLSYTITRGIVSAVAREVAGVDYLQTDASLNPGNSGGPVVDLAGRAVGVSTWGFRRASGLGFAVPVHSFYEALCEVAATPADVLASRVPSFRCHECRVQLSGLQRCGACGARVAFREDWDELASAGDVIAERAAWALVQRLGYDPAVCRVGTRTWRLTLEGGEVWVQSGDDGRILRVSTDVVKTPRPANPSFMRFLLTANDRSTGAARLALEGDVVTLSLVEPVELLDVAAVADVVRDVLALAARLREVLRSAFGAEPAPYGLESRLVR